MKTSKKLIGVALPLDAINAARVRQDAPIRRIPRIRARYRPADAPVKMRDATAGAVAPASNAPTSKEQACSAWPARNVSGP